MQLIKVGFDSCSISFLIKEIDNLNADSVDFCEAGRFSAFISEEMKMYPCSFMINKIEGEDLYVKDINQVWTEVVKKLKINKKGYTKRKRCAIIYK